MFRLTVKDLLGEISNVVFGMDWDFVLFIVIVSVILGLLNALLEYLFS